MDSMSERELAVSLYNRCWELLEAGARTPDDDVELLTSAFTSRFHWRRVGTPQQWVVSDWMVARAAGTVGYYSLAMAFALRANRAAQAGGLPDWLVASCAEGVARAYAVSGDRDRVKEWANRAATLVAAIAGDEDRALIAAQLASIEVGPRPFAGEGVLSTRGARRIV